MLRSTTLRLAALYTAGFAVSVVGLGLATLLATRAALAREIDLTVRAEMAAQVREFGTEGLTALIQGVRERDQAPGAMGYGLSDAQGRPVAGRLGAVQAPAGWSRITVQTRGRRPETLRLFTTVLPDGERLMVGDNLNHIQALDSVVLTTFPWALGGVLLLGGIGAVGLSREVDRRMAAISNTAEAIINGDLGRRIPIQGAGDDLEGLAMTVNRMLDRIGDLMESVRHVTNDIAHDLRTPLTRLRRKLETAQAAPECDPKVIDDALSELDSILDTFQALLRIAEVESGARRAAFQRTDLSAVAQRVIQAFAPAAEDGGQVLELDASHRAWIPGDPDLLTQMLANLVENGMIHGGSEVSVRVAVRTLPGRLVLTVSDTGPGVPEAERERLFDRFYRLEPSRSKPGSGLGLSLVAAVVKLHGASISLDDAGPGLVVRIEFPQVQPIM